MADIPSPLTWGTVRGNFGALNADSSDPGLVPDLDTVQGTVTLTPRIPLVKILNPLNPMIAIAKTVQCAIINGVLIGPDGQPNVRVVATDSPGFEPAPLQWDVRIQIIGATVQPSPMTIDVLGGQVVDLALVVPAQPAIPVVTVVTEATKLAALAAAAEAQASAQAALGSSIDASNALQDALAARVDAINAKNSAEAASATSVSSRNTAVSAATTATTAKTGAESSAASAAASKTAAEIAADRAEEAASNTLPSGGTITDFLRGDSNWAPLNKSAVGLPNVDNTSDSAKPISSATQIALDTITSKPTVVPVQYSGSAWPARPATSANDIVLWIGNPGGATPPDMQSRDIWTQTETSNMGVWMPTSATVTGGTTDPALGTGGSATGRYVRIGDTVTFMFRILFGTNAQAGSGVYRIIPPVLHNFAMGGTTLPLGSASLLDFSASARLLGQVVPEANGTLGIRMNPTGTAASAPIVGGASPWTWAASDVIEGSCTYEVAPL